MTGGQRSEVRGPKENIGDMPDDLALRVRGIRKKFCKSLRRSMAYGIADLARDVVGVPQDRCRLRKDEFWALDGIDFELKKGEILGIIGANGSGKTTLLRILAGIFPPDRGTVALRGRVACLIALGAGFHPHMTGRENTYLNGTILGMTRAEIDSKLEGIVDFAGVGDFFDAPVATYSSGMRVRLGFSVAIHLDPDVLFVDEVLAVGDASFRAKSYERMLGFLQKGRTICLVSHDLMAIEALCNRVLCMDRGVIRMDGKAQDVIPAYRVDQDRRLLQEGVAEKTAGHAETREIVIMGCETLNQDMAATQEFHYLDRLIVRLHYDAKVRVEKPFFMVAVIFVTTGATIFNASMLRDGGEPDSLEGKGWLDIDFGPLSLYPGTYRIRGQIRKYSTVEYFCYRELGSFAVVSTAEEYGATGSFAASYIRTSSAFVVPASYGWGKADTPVTDLSAMDTDRSRAE